ncbi:protein moonraker isoform X2 [Rhinichthys klamathensis goyatoka]|uniref:protein moonraker isoform X2 n=1 Tax=Rhinichthys klamathensis goyatoka TaxID=3034132 RepID=UPI0024B4E48D|nr:protein moonraker isoform X2 [Rhinichthys klamathensis goyatoka]
MISDFQRGYAMTIGELGPVNREWIKKGSPVSQMAGLQTQLQFNNIMAPSVLNRATGVGPPSPIVIEKLIPRLERQDDMESCSSSLRLSVLSEERLQAAVRLARRDLRRKRQESISRSSLEPAERSQIISPERSNTDYSPHVVYPKISGPKKQIKNRDQVLVYTPQNTNRQLKQGPTPTKDFDLRVNSSEPQLSQEIRKLQKELSTYVQRIEQLVNKECVVEVLEPDEKHRMEIRRQEQAARSARIIYVLQQQIKEVQEDLDKLRSQNVKHTQKSKALDRLAAAHRGAVRAMQVFINQLSDPTESRVPTHCKELGQLIRQLSLCSAKVQAGQGSTVPETALDILQKLETLDSALSKQKAPRKRDVDLQIVNPVENTSSRVRARSMSPPRPARDPAERTSRRPRKSAAAKKPGGSRLAGKSHKTSQALVKERNEVLKAGLESLIHHQKLREADAQKPNKTTSAINPDHVKAAHLRDASFQQPTVSSRLRENQVPQKEPTVPWMPTSPHSPPRPRCSAVSSRPEPRCLFSPQKSPIKQKPQTNSSTQLLSHDRKQAQNEALRQAWLDRVTADRLRELNRLSKEEADRINKLRTTVGSPTQWAEKAERAIKVRIQPLLDRAQVVEAGSDTLRAQLKVVDKPGARADVLSDALLDDLLEDAAQALWVTERQQVAETDAERKLQDPTLESMLLRMEEMERDQEDVRRRFAMISYSDPLIWEKGTDDPRNISSSRPASPQPIRLTKPVLNAPSSADILLQKPVETGAASDTSMLDEECLTLNDPRNPVSAGGESTRGTYLTVPPSMQRSIQKYRENHDAFLCLVSHEALGSFNPWAIADSLADELMAEALADVAAEFQDVCEEYAEAVFTSEFLQPVQSPTTSVS